MARSVSMAWQSTWVLPDQLEYLITSRRTHMRVDRDREIDAATIEWLCTLATWAPNHKHTWPWRFASFTGDGRARLGAAFVDDMKSGRVGDPGKHTKTLTKYLRTPNTLVVGCAANDHETFHAENRDAVAAGVQNILLGATAKGLASFWSTPPMMSGPQSLARCGFEPDVRIIAVIYLGYPTGSVPAPARPAPTITTIN